MNSEIPGYDRLIERTKQYLGNNEEGDAYLYVPFVFFVKDGEIVFTHQNTVDGYDPTIVAIPYELTEKLKGIYQQGFDLIS